MRNILLSAVVLFAFAAPAMAQNSEGSGTLPKCGADRVMEVWLQPVTSEGRLLETIPLEPVEFVCVKANVGDNARPYRIQHMPGSYAYEADAQKAFDAWRIAIVNGVQAADIERFLQLDPTIRQAIVAILSTNANSGAEMVFKTFEQLGVKSGKAQALK